MFSTIKQQVKERFDTLAQTQLFTVEPDRDKIWELYLNGFSEDVRQEHNCNCCKSFLRQYGGIVSLKNNKVQSLWDIEVEDEYKQSIKNVKEYVLSLPIKNIFLSTFRNLGTDSNTVITENGPVIWQHFYVLLPKELIHRGLSVETKQGEVRDNKNVLKRSLDELTIDATETVLELISQNSLYRGNEFKSLLESFLSIQKEYKQLNVKDQDNFCWAKSNTIPSSTSRIRNTSIGTLLIDLSSNRDLNEAVSAFERVVAPTNYKRPTAIVTPRMVEEAKRRLEELGLIDSLERRFANQGDVSVENVLFTDKVNPLTDVFGEMIKDSTINPKSLSKTEQISIEKFISDVLPKSKGLEVLLENSHLNNMVSLLTSVNKNSNTMFKWNNDFSWSYTGGITDSIKEKVKAAGGNVEGYLRVSLSWFNYDDLDLHVTEPGGSEIYYQNKTGRTGGILDVDMNAGSGKTREAVENIIWRDSFKMVEGIYKVRVKNFQKREIEDSGFIVQYEYNGESLDFNLDKSPNDSQIVTVFEFKYSKKDGVSLVSSVEPSQSKIVSKEKWGLKTNQFYKVKTMMLSPNHWESNIGNKHYLFFLENCISDENPRPFFNEFLKEELLKEKRIFETMAGKLKVEHSLPQLSGIGFSETQPNHLYVNVLGNFKRTLKITF